MGFLAAVTSARKRTTATLAAVAMAASLASAYAGDDETVVVPLIAYLGTGGYELALDDTTEPSIRPCFPPNRPFLGAADDPVLVGRAGDAIVFEGRWLDPSRFLVEPPDDGGEGDTFVAPEMVRFALTLPWTDEYRTLDVFASPADREAGAPLLQVDLANAASAYLESGGREQRDVICQDPEAWAEQREQVDTDARIGEALDEIGADDPR